MKKIVAGMLLAMGFLWGSIHACCIQISHVWADTLCHCDGNMTVRINFVDPMTIPLDTISSIVSQGDFLTHLVDTFNTSGSCFIARVTGITEFWTPFDTSGKSRFCNQVSVTVESVLKGSAVPTSFVIIDTLIDRSKHIEQNKETGKIDTLTMMISLNDRGYQPWSGIRYIGFAQSVTPSENEMLPRRSAPCGPSLVGYVISDNGDIWTALYTLNKESGTIAGFMGLALELSRFQSSILVSTKPAPRTNQRETVALGANVFNLRGELITSTRKSPNINVSASRTPGLYLHKSKSGAFKTLLHQR